jgi:transposase
MQSDHLIAKPLYAQAAVCPEIDDEKAAGKREIPLWSIAIEILRHIDALFEIERSINGKSPAERLAVRQKLSSPVVEELEVYMRAQLGPAVPRA